MTSKLTQRLSLVLRTFVIVGLAGGASVALLSLTGPLGLPLVAIIVVGAGGALHVEWT